MKAVYNISYGLYVITATTDKLNGCLNNTFMQVTTSPNRVIVTLNKDNYTTKQIQQTKEFNASILDNTTDFELIKHFGFQSGKDVNKFESFFSFDMADNGIPYITKSTNSYLTCKVVQEIDLGTHIEFIADVVGDFVLSGNPSITYDYYQKNIKPKPQKYKKTVWVCSVCGYVYEGEELPEDFVCPMCNHDASFFVKQEVQ